MMLLFVVGSCHRQLFVIHSFRSNPSTSCSRHNVHFHLTVCCHYYYATFYCRAMLWKRPVRRHVVFVCPSRSCILSKWKKNIFKMLSCTVGYTILSFPHQTLWRYSDGDPLTVASNAGGVGRNRDSEPISCSIACCEWLETTTKCMTRNLDVTLKISSS